MLKLEEVRPAVAALLTHGALLGRLAHVEWRAEKQRLARLFALSLFSAAMAVVVLLSISILVMTLAWDTDYRWLAALALVVFYAAGLVLAVRRLIHLFSIKESAFAGTCEELAADIALLKRRLLP